MSTERPSAVAPVCFIVGALLGLVGSFVSSASLRGLAWGIDGIALIVAAAILVVHCLRQSYTLVGAGFLVFIAGETLVLSGSSMSLADASPLFGAGAALWAAGLVLISAPAIMPLPVRAFGHVAALLFGATALQILAGRSINALSKPLPFFAYPALVLTVLGWAWWCWRPSPKA